MAAEKTSQKLPKPGSDGASKKPFDLTAFYSCLTDDWVIGCCCFLSIFFSSSFWKFSPKAALKFSAHLIDSRMQGMREKITTKITLLIY
jgi:hypothetical protein